MAWKDAVDCILSSWLQLFSLPTCIAFLLLLLLLLVLCMALLLVVFLFSMKKVHLLKYNISGKPALLVIPQMFSTENIKVWGLQLCGLESWYSQIKFETVAGEYVSVFTNVHLSFSLYDLLRGCALESSLSVAGICGYVFCRGTYEWRL